TRAWFGESPVSSLLATLSSRLPTRSRPLGNLEIGLFPKPQPTVAHPFHKGLKERHLRSQFFAQRRSVRKSSSAKEIQRDLAVGPLAVGRSDRPANRLSQVRVIDEGAFLFREAGGREHIACVLTRRRGEQILHDEQRHAKQRVGLGRREPIA